MNLQLLIKCPITKRILISCTFVLFSLIFNTSNILASAHYTPTGGTLVSGSEATITSASTSGNTGSWKGTLATETTGDGFNWTVNNSTSTGLNQQIQIDNVLLNNANKMIVNIRAKGSTTSLPRLYQICDWVSSTGVENAADGTYCTGGGWRTLNLNIGNTSTRSITSTTMTTYTWHIYNGYFGVLGLARDTPLSNFIKSDSTKRVLLRAYTTSTTTATHSIDWVNISTIIDPVYSAAEDDVISTYMSIPSYNFTINALYSGQPATDGYAAVLDGDQSTDIDYVLYFKDIRTFNNLNTIVLSTNIKCTTNASLVVEQQIMYIYNYTTSSWAYFDSGYQNDCADVSYNTVQVSKVITTSDYISNGQIKIRYYVPAFTGEAVYTTLGIDMAYIVLGTTKTNTNDCETSLGSNYDSSNCSYTNVIDLFSFGNTRWAIQSENETSSSAKSYYAYDNDADTTQTESVIAVNMGIPFDPPTNASLVYLGYSTRYVSNSTSLTLQPQYKDFQGENPTISGGWTNFPSGTSNSSTSLSYYDLVTNGYFISDPRDYFDQTNNLVNVRFRTSTTTTTSSVTSSIDFFMFTYSWMEHDNSIVSLQSHYSPTGGALEAGSETTITMTSSGNTGSWKGLLSYDSFSWAVTTNASGLKQHVYIDNVNLNGANKLMVILRAGSSSTSLTRAYQICDWVSSTSVDAAADGTYCTGGGWRTMNIRKANITTLAVTNLTWHLYDGYWTTSTTGNTTVSTPLSNFVKNDSTKRVLIRAYSTVTTTYTHFLYWARVSPVIDSMYSASGFTQITGGSVSTSYINTINAALLGQSSYDASYLEVPGTASSISDFYLSYKNIKRYTGMNTITLVSVYSCSSTGINIMPKIYDFNASSWVNIGGTAKACSTTRAYAYISISDIDKYISNGEVRIGWYGSANSTVGIRIDLQYIILGSVNDNSSLCEVSFGSESLSTCTGSRNLLIFPSIGVSSTWDLSTEAESSSFSHTYYAYDNDGDATNSEHAVSANLSVPLTIPSNTSPVLLGYSTYFKGNTGLTARPQIKDLQSNNTADKGGWNDIATTNATTSYTYYDYTINNFYLIIDPLDHIETNNNLVNIRYRTQASTITTASTASVDYTLATLAWSEGPSPTLTQESYRFFNNSNSTDVGTTLANLNTPATLSSIGDEFRLRMNLKVDTAQLPINSEFKLQYAGKGAGSCTSPSGTPSTYTDISTTTHIAYYDNSTPIDNSALTANANDPTSSYTIKNQTYEELNNFKNSVSAIPSGYAGKWDFSLTDYNGGGNTYCIRAIDSAGNVLNTYTNYPEITTASLNTAPNVPSSLTQKKYSDSSTITLASWINEDDVKFGALLSDTDNPDTLYLCVEVQPLGTSFTNTETACGTGVSYSGTGVSAEVDILNITEAYEYHWQARTKDAGGLYSSWVSFGGNLESESDFGIDTSPPSALSVYDGTSSGVDMMFNDGSLSSLSANWANVNANASGLANYDYSIGTTQGGTDIKSWTDVDLATSVTATSLTLQSSIMYFFNIRVTDNAGNTAVFSSDGQRVLPTLSFSLSNYSVLFDNLNSGNSYTDTKATTITTSTNAYGGYVVRLFKSDSLKSIQYPSVTIGDFDGGTYANPGGWSSSNYGFGYHSSDTLIQGENKFNPPKFCLHGGTPPCYAPFSSSPPGDIVADHTANVSGSPIINEQFVITYKISTQETQRASTYTTTLVYTISPQF